MAAYKYPDEWKTGPIRLRLLRHWSRAADSMRGMWLLVIEPSWPIVSFHKEEHLDEMACAIPTKDDHSLDIVLEHYKPNMPGRGCNGTICSIDLFDLARWLK